MSKESELLATTGLFTQLQNPHTGEAITFHFEGGQNRLPVTLVLPDRQVRMSLCAVVDEEGGEYDVRLQLVPEGSPPSQRVRSLPQESRLVSEQLAKSPDSPATAVGTAIGVSQTYIPKESKLVSEQLAKDPMSAATARGVATPASLYGGGLAKAPPPPSREENPSSVFEPMKSPEAATSPTRDPSLGAGGEHHPQSVFAPGQTQAPEPSPPEPPGDAGAGDPLSGLGQAPPAPQAGAGEAGKVAVEGKGQGGQKGAPKGTPKS